eukprot:44756-Eustigmatos_ZCMA.PRE.1
MLRRALGRGIGAARCFHAGRPTLAKVLCADSIDPVSGITVESLVRHLIQFTSSASKSNCFCHRLILRGQCCIEIFKERGHHVDYKVGLSKDELLKIIGQYDGLVVRSATQVTKEVIEAGDKLAVIGRA